MRKPRRLRVILPVLLILGTALGNGGCGCAVSRVIDQATVTVRGLTAANEISQKANQGYDVRPARSKWMEALDAYNQGDFGRAERLINEVYSLLPTLELVAERVHYPSRDGLTVSGLLFRPREGDGPWPTVIVNHAGFGTAGDFTDVALLIRDRGYLVFNPDFRGSGESQGRHEGAKGEVDDVIAAVDYLISRGMVRDGRVAMYGQSHGAAVSVLAAEKDPRIRAVVAEAGFYDAADLYYKAKESPDPTVRSLLDQFVPMVGGTPEEVPGEYAVRSALNHVDTMQAATLIIHGAKDPLCPVDQAYRLYEALKAAGKTVEIKVYPDEAHCVNSPAGRLEVWELMFAWFEKYM